MDTLESLNETETTPPVQTITPEKPAVTITQDPDDILSSVDFSEPNLGETDEEKEKATDQNQEGIPAEQSATQSISGEGSNSNLTQQVQQQQNNNNSQDISNQNSGAYRRLYEDLQTSKNELTTANDKLNIYEKNAGQLNNIGLDQQSLLQAAQFYQGFQDSPETFVTNLLANMKANGYNLDNSNSAIDTQAISTLIDNKLKPITNRYEAETKQSEDLAAAQKEVTTFFGANPHAKVHENVIAKMITDNPSWSLIKAYDELRVFTAQNQYDLSKPLAEQVKARNSKQPNTPVVPQNNNPSGMPLNLTSADAGNVATPQPIIANPDDSFADIITSVMKDNGLHK